MINRTIPELLKHADTWDKVLAAMPAETVAKGTEVLVRLETQYSPQPTPQELLSCVQALQFQIGQLFSMQLKMLVEIQQLRDDVDTHTRSVIHRQLADPNQRFK